MQIQQHLYDKERSKGAWKKRNVPINKAPRPKSKSNLRLIKDLNG
jgi:hypothetical protein